MKELKAIEENCGVAVNNLGTGRGYSVLELVHAFEEVGGVTIPYVIEERRPSDIAVCYMYRDMQLAEETVRDEVLREN